MNKNLSLPYKGDTASDEVAFFIINTGRSDGLAGQSDEGRGVVGSSIEQAGVHGDSISGSGSTGASVNNTGMFGSSISGRGVVGESISNIGVSGESMTGGTGVFGRSLSGTGIEGFSDSGFAGYFHGNVFISGALEKAGGGFRIDHLLDPANKYLYHSFVESSEMKNLYDDVVILDDDGAATVGLPDWFETLNEKFRYQLTALGQAAPNLHILEEISDHHFKIAGGQAGMRVAWQVTGCRCDPWARANPQRTETDKLASEKNYYLHPELYGQPQERSIEWSQMNKG